VEQFGKRPTATTVDTLRREFVMAIKAERKAELIYEKVVEWERLRDAALKGRRKEKGGEEDEKI